MLHDPKWNHGTLSGLITWLEGKPRDQAYYYLDSCNCLIQQYMGDVHFLMWSNEMQAIYQGADEFKIAYGEGVGRTHTYGQALERAYKAREAVTA